MILLSLLMTFLFSSKPHKNKLSIFSLTDNISIQFTLCYSFVYDDIKNKTKEIISLENDPEHDPVWEA